MSMTVAEAYNGARLTKGANPSGEIRYFVFGVDSTTSGFSEASIIAEVATEAPSNFDGIPRTDISVEQVADEVWQATVTYGKRGGATRQAVAGQSFSWSFNTTGQTQTVQMALTQTATSLITGANPPENIGNQIAVDQDGVPQGVDIVAPKLEFSETHTIAASVVETTTGGIGSWVRGLSAATGKVNSDTFRGFSPGEVLFLGASGSRQGDVYEITFQFACSPNIAALPLKTYDASGQIEAGSGAGTTIAKGGHEYVWFLFQKSEDATTKLVTPISSSVFVATVYESTTFASVIPVPAA
jgi:hypothetical protein